MVDFSKAEARISSDTVEILEDGVKWSGEFFFLIPVSGLPRGATIVASYTSDVAGPWRVQYSDNSYSTNPIFEGTPITLDSAKEIEYIVIYKRNAGTFESDMVFTDIQLEFGSTPTPYEPYQPGTTATLTFPETIYGGTVDAVTGEGSNETIMFELAVADMDNDENYPGWRMVSNLTDAIGVGYNGILNNEQFKACNITKSALSTASIGYFGVNTLGTNSILYLTKDTFGLTQTQWKEQYPDLVLQLCLKRISPESFQVTGNQALPAVAGLNTVYTDGDSLAVSGRQDLLYTLQTMQAQTQNLNRFIAEGGAQQ